MDNKTIENIEKTKYEPETKGPDEPFFTISDKSWAVKWDTTESMPIRIKINV